MGRQWMFLVHMVSFLLSVLTMVLLVVPIEFKNPTVRHSYADQGPVDNDSLVEHMVVDQFLNLLIPEADPHFDVKGEDLLRAWRLPPTTRLSARMEKIARCRLALQHTKAPINVVECHRIEVGWPVLAILVAMFQAAYFLSGQPVNDVSGWKRDTPTEWKKKWSRGVIVSMINCSMWLVVNLCVLRATGGMADGIGVTFVWPGNVHPEAYYQFPIVWTAVFYLCLANYFAKLFEAAFFFFNRKKPTGAVARKKKMRIAVAKVEKERWEMAEYVFRQENAKVSPKILARVIKHCKANYTFDVLRDLGPFSPVFIEAVEKKKKTKRSKRTKKTVA